MLWSFLGFRDESLFISAQELSEEFSSEDPNDYQLIVLEKRTK
jgi:hypothetical protein